jgi:hypothetical protein
VRIVVGGWSLGYWERRRLPEKSLYIGPSIGQHPAELDAALSEAREIHMKRFGRRRNVRTNLTLTIMRGCPFRDARESEQIPCQR